MEWTELLATLGPALIAALVGVAGIIGTLWGSLAEGRRVERLARLQILTQSTSQLLALGYKVRRTVQAYIDEAEYEQVVGVTTTFQKEDLGDVVQRANVLAAECLVSGGKRLGASAIALVKVVSAQVDALAVTFGPDELALDPGLDAASLHSSKRAATPSGSETMGHDEPQAT